MLLIYFKMIIILLETGNEHNLVEYIMLEPIVFNVHHMVSQQIR